MKKTILRPNKIEIWFVFIQFPTSNTIRSNNDCRDGREERKAGRANCLFRFSERSKMTRSLMFRPSRPSLCRRRIKSARKFCSWSSLCRSLSIRFLPLSINSSTSKIGCRFASKESLRWMRSSVRLANVSPACASLYTLCCCTMYHTCKCDQKSCWLSIASRLTS